MPTAAAADDGDATDGALMAAYAAGNAAAFQQLYVRHRAGLYRFVQRLLGPAMAAQADEVFQDTWLRVVQARHDFIPRGAVDSAAVPMARFRTWLYTLAHHRAVDLLRKGGRETALPDADDDPGPAWQPDGTAWAGWPAADTPGAADALFWRRAGKRLLDCLAELPPGQRAVFLLHHEDGIGVAEIGVALQLGFETAKSRLRYAMTKLRLCMGAYLPMQDLS
ncbi:MAG: sigma-70 family RNA polymerase sigma factor [Aquabacterium sp.]